MSRCLTPQELACTRPHVKLAPHSAEQSAAFNFALQFSFPISLLLHLLKDITGLFSPLIIIVTSAGTKDARTAGNKVKLQRKLERST